MRKNIIITWYLRKDSKNKEHVITEKISIEDFVNYFKEYGTISEEIFQICMIKSIFKKVESDFNIYSLIDLIIKEKSDNTSLNNLYAYISKFDISKENNSKDSQYLKYDILEKIAYSFVYDYCKKCIDTGKYYDSSYKNNSVYLVLNKIMQIYLDDNNLDNESEKSLYKQLIEALKENNILKKEFLDNKKKEKCIAAYATDDGRKIVAFSGGKDCNCIKLLNSFKNLNNKFYNDLLKLTDAIHVELATTSCNVSRYRLSTNQKQNVIRFDSINDLKVLGRKKVDYHSCCERKIFAHLEDENEVVNSGELYINKFPCDECSLAMLYHIIFKGNTVKLEVTKPNVKEG